ncbi:MAG: tetratricopeptide repeat protein [Alphaproteobacteria bacterium]|nr:tetratricopeptide repeat protein [Alphaproteobacteria bacterium]
MAAHGSTSGPSTLRPDTLTGSVSEIMRAARDAYRDENYVQTETILRQLLEQNARIAAAWLLRGRAAYARNLLTDAATCFVQAAKLSDENALPRALLAEILEKMDRPAEAAASWSDALNRAPGDAVYHARFAAALQRLGKTADAIHHYRAALTLRTDWPEIHSNLAAALLDAGHAAEAVSAAEAALAVNPDLVSALNNLGLALCSLDRHGEAVAPLRKALSLAPDNLEAAHNLAVIRHRLGDIATAETALRTLLQQRPNWAEAQRSLGNLLRETGQLDDAARCYRAVLAGLPLDFKTYGNLGLVLLNQNRPHDAIAVYEKALALEPDQADIRMSLGIAQLAAGDFDQGWSNYEARWRAATFSSPKREFSAPRWQGEPLGPNAGAAGRRLLIHAEQGFGDTLQFCRYIPLVADQGGSVIVECQPALRRLLESVAASSADGRITVISRGDDLPPADFQVPLLSLPHILRTTLSTIPASVPYLRASEPEALAWRHRLGSGCLNVGLVWSGNAKRQDDQMRSCSIDALRPLLGLPGLRLFSLQKDRREPLPDGIEDLAPDLRDFGATAAAIGALDLVISVDTAAAHLAGAMARPVWVLLGYAADWRYLLDRDDSPWYPTMRLFRQARPGDWSLPVRDIGEALAAFRPPVDR